jgi:hypothetical protein
MKVVIGSCDGFQITGYANFPLREDIFWNHSFLVSLQVKLSVFMTKLELQAENYEFMTGEKPCNNSLGNTRYMTVEKVGSRASC